MYHTRNRGGRAHSPFHKGARFGKRSHTAHAVRPHAQHQPRFARFARKRTTFDVSQYINRNPAVAAPVNTYVPKHTFADFGLNKHLVMAITKMNLLAPTHIQDEVIPLILKELDVVGVANTGTGKTAAFLIPLIELTLREQSRQTLILTPTRELAIQVEQELRRLSAGVHIYSTVCVGGANIRMQISNLKRKNHFVIGTPGRLLDLVNKKFLRLNEFSAVVLDEADRMLDMGFIHDMRKILGGMPAKRGTFFFSATISPPVGLLIRTFSKDPVTVSVKERDITSNIEQDVVRCGHDNKFTVLTNLLKQEHFTRVLIFGAMKHSVERLKKQLTAEGIPAESIHGNKSQSQRQKALHRFKHNDVRILVATDVAARGIHVDNISHVINYDLPSTYEDYVHRIGRTGRGTKFGKALSFVS